METVLYNDIREFDNEKSNIGIMEFAYPAILIPCREKEGYTVVVPDLPGCVTEGSDLVNAIEMAVDAASGWVLDELEEGRPAPACSDINDIKPIEDGAFVTMIICDMAEYSKKIYFNGE